MAWLGELRTSRTRVRHSHSRRYERSDLSALIASRRGSYLPSGRAARKRGAQARIAVVAEASVQGVCTRTGAALGQTMGSAGISTSEVRRLCAVLAVQGAAFRTRRWVAA
jgi:transposase-like protein